MVFSLRLARFLPRPLPSNRTFGSCCGSPCGSPSKMAGFQVALTGRFWVAPDIPGAAAHGDPVAQDHLHVAALHQCRQILPPRPHLRLGGQSRRSRNRQRRPRQRRQAGRQSCGGFLTAKDHRLNIVAGARSGVRSGPFQCSCSAKRGGPRSSTPAPSTPTSSIFLGWPPSVRRSCRNLPRRLVNR
jgi:hypothetical protein